MVKCKKLDKSVLFLMILLVSFVGVSSFVYALPTTSLVSPANNTVANISAQTFNCNITDSVGISNLTLHLWNSTGSALFDSPYLVWNKTLGDASDAGIAIAIDNSNNIYVWGVDYSPRGVLLKYDSNGVLLWNKSSNILAGEYGNKLMIDAAENIYAIGNGVNSALIEKYDGNGNRLWNKTLGNSGYQGYGLAKDSAGNIYAVGSEDGTIKYGVWITKLDSGGNLLWNTTAGGASYESGLGITIDSSDNIYVAGYTGTNGGDFWILKYDINGNQIWAKTYGGGAQESPSAITNDLFGNVYITGYTKSVGAGGMDFWTIKIDSAGNQLWAKTAGNPTDDDGDAITTDSISNVYVAGRLNVLGSHNLSVIKYDASGNLLWNKIESDSCNQAGYGIKRDSNGDIYVTGSTNSCGVNNRNGILTLKYSEPTKYLSGTSASSSWQFNLPSEGSYKWSCSGYDTSGNNAWASSNYTLTYDLCTPSLTNTSESAWQNDGICLINNTQLQNRTKIQYDANYCNEIANTTITEFRYVACATASPCSPLVAQWNFNENAGTVAVDSSEDGNNGTINGAVWVSGINGSALKFDGIDDYVNVPASNSLNLSGNITIEAWVKLDSWNWPNDNNHSYSGIVSKFDINGGYLLTIQRPLQKLNFGLRTNSTDFQGVYSDSLELNKWYYVVGVFENNTLETYVNGIKQPSIANYTLPYTSGLGLNIGRYLSNNYAFNGTIDEVKIWIRALNDTEILSYYNANKPCVENWSVNYGSCLINDTKLKYYTDLNSCGTTNDLPVENGTYASCDYCSFSLVNASWSSWTDQTACLFNDTKIQNSSMQEYDANYATCYAVTGIGSDLWNSGNNMTFWNYTTTVCDFCTPSLTNTSWSSWADTTSCLANNTMEQMRNKTQYDSNSCGEISNTTFTEMQVTSCNAYAPVISFFTPSNQNYKINKDAIITFNHTSTDAGELNYSWLLNDIQQATTQAWQHAFTTAGKYNVTLIVTDGTFNTTNKWNITVNTPPAINNIIVNDANYQHDSINMSYKKSLTFYQNASDVEGDTLTYSWLFTDDMSASSLANLTHSFETKGENYKIIFNVSDGLAVTSKEILFNVSGPTFIGNLDNVTTNINQSELNISVNNSNDLNINYSGTAEVKFTQANKPIAEFNFNFSTKVLDLTNITIKREDASATKAYILIKGINLPSSETKTLYIDKVNTNMNYVCIKDADVNDISEMTSNCNGASETRINCNGILNNGYMCENNGTRYKITGLRHSAVQQTDCTETWTCTDWSACSSSTQTRTCTDANACGTTASKPAESQSCSTTPPSSPSGGGGGGSSGGGSSSGGSIGVIASPKMSFDISEIKSGIPKSLQIIGDVIPISEIVLTPNKDLKGISLLVEKLNEKPSTINKPQEQVYQYISIIKGKFDNSDLSDVKIKFKVPKQWFIDNNADETKVYLQRFETTNGAKLPTLKAGESAGNIYYEAQSSGFSYFAITATSKAIMQEANSTQGSNVVVTGSEKQSELKNTQSTNAITGAAVSSNLGKGSKLITGIVITALVTATLMSLVYVRYFRKRKNK